MSSSAATITRPRRVAGRPTNTARVKTAAPVGEAGYTMAASDGWINWDPFEKVPTLQWPQSVNVFLEMDNDDSRVSSLLEAISLPILSAAWRIDPNGAPGDVVKFVSQNLGVPVVGEDTVDNGGRSRGRFSWSEHLRMLASPVPQFGHAVFEQVYRRDGDRLVLRKLGARPQWTIQRFNVAVDGGLDSITQLAPAASPQRRGVIDTDIGINRLVVYTRNMRPGHWYGRSILRPSYKHWLLKNELLRIQVAVARRNGMGVPVGVASRPDDPNEVEAMRRIAAGFRGGLHSGVGLAQGQSLSLLGVQGNLPDIGTAIDYHDKAIALSGLAHFLNLNTGGSFALAQVQERPFVQALNAAADALRETFQQHVIEDLVDVNFGTEVRVPRLVFEKIGSHQDATALALKTLVDAGLLAPDLRIERALRQMLDLPAKPDEGDPDSEPPAGKPEPTPAPAPPQTSAPDPEEEPAAVLDVEEMRHTLHPFSDTGGTSAQ